MKFKDMKEKVDHIEKLQKRVDELIHYIQFGSFDTNGGSSQLPAGSFLALKQLAANERNALLQEIRSCES